MFYRQSKRYFFLDVSTTNSFYQLPLVLATNRRDSVFKKKVILDIGLARVNTQVLHDINEKKTYF